MTHVRFLAESENYKVTSDYETVYLNFKNSGRSRVIIGDFYGDPASALISRDERYVAMAGCGLIIYSLDEPFEPYNYGQDSQQWQEYYRGPAPENLWWCEALFQLDIDNDWKYLRFVAGNFNAVFRLDTTNGCFQSIGQDGGAVCPDSGRG